MQNELYTSYIKLKKLSDCHAKISPVSALIEMELAQNESQLRDHEVAIFCKSTCANVHQHECTKGTGIT